MKLRHYQIEAVNSVITFLKTKEGSCLVSAATGTGKSVIIAELCRRLIVANPDIKILVATHVAELLDQNSKKLSTVMPQADIGVFSAGLGRKELGHQITFAGIQSIYRHDIGKINLLIVDEAHAIGRKDTGMWKSFIEKLKKENPKIRIVGLSATTFRMDSGNLTSGEDAIFDEICFDYGLGRAIQDGYLVKLTPKGTKTKYNIDSVGKVAGEFNLKELEAATNIDDLTRSAVSEMIEAGKNRKTWLIFCNGIKHSFAVAEEIRRMGISCETVTGETPDNIRMDILKRFKEGTLRAVTNNAVWTTGVDVPNVDLIGMLRHTMSGGLLLQMAGRGTRTIIDLSQYNSPTERKNAIELSEKPNCLFLDFAGNIQRHGFLDQIKGYDKKEKKDGAPPMKICDECFSIVHASAKKCPDCGFIFPINTVQMIGDAYNGNIISENQVREVVGVQYMPHNLNKEGKIPCLKVMYIHDDGTTTKEYICLQHSGFAFQKALKWWNDRGGCTLNGATIKEIIDLNVCDDLKVPSKITVTKEGKFDRIVNYDFSKKESAEMTHEEITVF